MTNHAIATLSVFLFLNSQKLLHKEVLKCLIYLNEQKVSKKKPNTINNIFYTLSTKYVQMVSMNMFIYFRLVHQPRWFNWFPCLWSCLWACFLCCLCRILCTVFNRLRNTRSGVPLQTFAFPTLSKKPSIQTSRWVIAKMQKIWLVSKINSVQCSNCFQKALLQFQINVTKFEATFTLTPSSVQKVRSCNQSLLYSSSNVHTVCLNFVNYWSNWHENCSRILKLFWPRALWKYLNRPGLLNLIFLCFLLTVFGWKAWKKSFG